MFNKEDIKRIDFLYGLCNSDGEIISKQTNMVAIYNKTKIDFNDVKKAIECYGVGENQFVIFMTEKQFNNVFESEE